MSYDGKAIMFDMDGVLYRGTSPLPPAGEVVDWCRAQGFKLGFIANNSTREPKTFQERLAGYDVNAELDEILTSAVATAEYIKQTYGEGGRAFVIGMEGIPLALNNVGVEVAGLDDKRKCDYVVVGMTPEFNYKHLTRAQQEILVNNAKFIGTNGDRTFPWNDGSVRPGGGTMVAAVFACTDVTPTVIGKPELHMIDQMASRMKFEPRDCIVVGDRLDTDIVSGNRFGAHTVCVLTGIAAREDAETAVGELKPEFIIDDMSGFKEIVTRLWG